MKPSEQLKSRMVTTEQGLRFAEKDREKILKELEYITKKIMNYREEIMQAQLAIPELEKRGL